MKKDYLDRLNILQKADIIKIRAIEIINKNKTISKKRAYDIAAEELFRCRQTYY